MCNEYSDLASLLHNLLRILKRYELKTDVCAGKGSYGTVVRGEDTVSRELVAFKVECGGTKFTCNEIAAYRALKGMDGIPKYHQAVGFRDHGVLIVELLGRDLSVYMHSWGGSLPIHQVYALGRQLVRLVRQMHDRGVVHRDIKPDNILLPRSGELKPYLVDFGLANPLDGCESKIGWISIPPSYCGTPAFMSKAAHQCQASSRRDDIESLAYTLIFLAHGSLPWGNYSSSECLQQKFIFQVSDLWPYLPHELQRFLDHATSLKYDQIPDYYFLEELLC